MAEYGRYSVKSGKARIAAAQLLVVFCINAAMCLAVGANPENQTVDNNAPDPVRTNYSAFRGSTAKTETNDIKADATPIETKAVEPKYNITICTIVRDEAAYIMEWIEFHRLQGVDHFVIYSDRSIDAVEMYQDLFEEANMMDVVEVLPAVVRFSDFTEHNGSKTSHVITQRTIYHHCYRYIGEKTRWFLFIDVDEYLVTQRSMNLMDELNNPKWSATKSFLVPATVYSTNGVTQKYTIFPQLDTVTGKVQLSYIPANFYYNSPSFVNLPENVTSETSFPLDIERHYRRAPFPEIDGALVELPKECKNPNYGKWFYQCPQKIGKSFIRPNVCEQIRIHYCVKYIDSALVGGVSNEETGVSLWNISSSNEFLLHHFYARTELKILQEYDWKVVKRDAYSAYDKTYFSYIVDNSLSRRFSNLIRKSIHKFNIIPLLN